MASSAPEGAQAIALSRPIDRLPVRRLSNEPKEAMNCKSCRKRKIKCNRLRPSCEACQVFNVECVYDAVPKKRGPKTDVLEALLKRVNGLEKRLKDDNKPSSPTEIKDESAVIESSVSETTAAILTQQVEQVELEAQQHKNSQQQQQQQQQQNQAQPQQPQQQTTSQPKQNHTRPTLQKRKTQESIKAQLASHTPITPHQPSVGYTEAHSLPAHPTPNPYNSALLDVYFGKLHGKPYYILDEAATRQRWQAGQLPVTTVNAIQAITARYGQHLVGGYNSAVRLGHECAARARMALDSDEPTIENLQVSLLLSNAYFQAGKGKKSYMLLSSAVSMALALGLHRELPAAVRISPAEREGRRKLFWTCYLMDRFTAAGSKRPSLISDECIGLRLPAWPQDASSMHYEGNYFTNGNNMAVTAGPSGRMGQSTGAILIEIVRVLGITNRYLAAGGVKGDSHFPWHAQSNLSRIRQDLDFWANNNQEAFMSAEALFGRSDSSTLVLAKLIYHLIHCLVYRPFLPVDLTELAGTGQHQSWQIEATSFCFLHSNAIAELVEVGKASTMIDWPDFVGYCLCTAGTIHVHGAHYLGTDGDLFTRSAEFLSREMTQLNEIRIYYAGVQHQRETLQTVYGCHSQLVKSLASNPMRFSPVFQMEDFFDRYPGIYVDGAHVTFTDVAVESVHESLPAYEGLSGSNWHWTDQVQSGPAMMPPPARSVPTNGEARPKKKRRRTNDMNESPTSISPSIGEPAVNTAPTTDVSQTCHPLTIPNHGQQSLTTPSEHAESALELPTFTQNPFSPNFSLSPWPANLSLDTTTQAQYNGYGLSHEQAHMDLNGSNPFSFEPLDQQTPGGLSAHGSTLSETDKDPFLSLLEQLAENEHTQGGGPSDLDFFLSGQQ